MQPTAFSAAAQFTSLMEGFAKLARLRRPLTFLPARQRGITVSAKDQTVYLCRETILQLSPLALAVVAAHEVGHMLEYSKARRHALTSIVTSKSISLTLLACLLAAGPAGALAAGLVTFAGLFSIRSDHLVATQLTLARSEVFADAFACTHTGQTEAWTVAMGEYMKVVSTHDDDRLLYRRFMLNLLEEDTAMTAVLEKGTAVLADYERDERFPDPDLIARLKGDLVG